MVNPFTLQTKISRLQQEVLAPLYRNQNDHRHEWLLAETGRVIQKHKTFIEEVCQSRLISAIFKVVKMLGGAEQLTLADFEHFTNYVNDGGLNGMVTMLLAADKEKSFVKELQQLPAHVQENASPMLSSARTLHADFIKDYFKESFGSVQSTPKKLQENFVNSDKFISRLTHLAAQNMK